MIFRPDAEYYLGSYPGNIGTKKPNAWGLYDVTGSVGELVLDVVDTVDLKLKTTDIYTPITTGDYARRCLKGGNGGDFNYNQQDTYVATRRATAANSSASWFGFRVAFVKKN